MVIASCLFVREESGLDAGAIAIDGDGACGGRLAGRVVGNQLCPNIPGGFARWMVGAGEEAGSAMDLVNSRT